MPAKKTWQDKCFEDEENTWVSGQHVRKIQASCGCRLNVYADDVYPNPQLDTSHCSASIEGDKVARIKEAKKHILRLKAEVARLT